MITHLAHPFSSLLTVVPSRVHGGPPLIHCASLSHYQDNFNNLTNKLHLHLYKQIQFISGIFFIFADGDQVKELRETFKLATEYLQNCKSTISCYSTVRVHV